MEKRLATLGLCIFVLSGIFSHGKTSEIKKTSPLKKGPPRVTATLVTPKEEGFEWHKEYFMRSFTLSHWKEFKKNRRDWCIKLLHNQTNYRNIGVIETIPVDSLFVDEIEIKIILIVFEVERKWRTPSGKTETQTKR